MKLYPGSPVMCLLIQRTLTESGFTQTNDADEPQRRCGNLWKRPATAAYKNGACDNPKPHLCQYYVEERAAFTIGTNEGKLMMECSEQNSIR